ncbi:MAG: sensor histidine kinase [Candidatus Aminicenantes bacterium]|nr:sensor histidine kinase [Candidatus Aminicenantes bacterium]
MSADSLTTEGLDRERILNQLLLLQGTLHVMPTVMKLTEFAERATQSVPGVASVHICTAGRPRSPGPFFAAICDVCGIGKAASEAVVRAPCGLKNGGLLRSFGLRTQLGSYGAMTLVLDDESRFQPYAQHVENLANVLAINIENSAYKKQIETTNRSLVQEVAGHQRAEDKIAALLREKEILLKEVHHRIKNNMSSMISLLSLQAAALKNSEAVAALREARGRMRSMAVLYDKLYRSENLREMSLRTYLPPLIDEIAAVFPNQSSVKIETRIDDIMLGVRALSPLGIIVNELLTNAMRHAFAGRDEGSIIVSASAKDGRVTLVIEDDGSGIPESVDLANPGGFGLQLVGLLTAQLDGTLRIERGKGTRFVLEFGI